MSETRKAKYCPQCGTMAVLEATLCTTCGHRFHTGVVPPEAVIRPEDDDEFNKTQLFMMSPVLMQRPAEPVAPLPVGEEIQTPTRPSQVRRRLMLAAGVLVLLLALVWGASKWLAPVEVHPQAIVGRWARATTRGTVGLMFAADGSGALFWQPAPGAGAGAGGNVLLNWSQTPKGRLTLGAAQPVIGGPEVQQSVALLSSQTWDWNVEGRKLTLGKLSFMRQ